MKIGNYRIGMRTFKTGLSVMLCLLLFHFLDREPPMIAALSAVFGLREDWQKKFKIWENKNLRKFYWGYFCCFPSIIATIFGSIFLSRNDWCSSWCHSAHSLL